MQTEGLCSDLWQDWEGTAFPGLPWIRPTPKSHSGEPCDGLGTPRQRRHHVAQPGTFNTNISVTLLVQPKELELKKKIQASQWTYMKKWWNMGHQSKLSWRLRLYSTNSHFHGHPILLMSCICCAGEMRRGGRHLKSLLNNGIKVNESCDCSVHISP